MPHTWIVWGIYARIVHNHIAIQEMSAVRYPTVLKTSTFSIKDCEKHFQYVCYLFNSTTKLKIFSETNNTLRDIAQNVTIFLMYDMKLIRVVFLTTQQTLQLYRNTLQ